MDACEKKHNNIVNLVEQLLIDKGYEDIQKFVKYDFGEIDIYARKDKYILLFEVKSQCTCKSYNKARKQLDRAERLYFDDERIFKIFCYIEGKNVYFEWQKHTRKL